MRGSLRRFVVRASALYDALKRALRACKSLLPLDGGGLEVGVSGHRTSFDRAQDRLRYAPSLRSVATQDAFQSLGREISKARPNRLFDMLAQLWYIRCLEECTASMLPSCAPRLPGGC